MSTLFYFEQRRSEVISTYALCGFANVGSIGMQLGMFAILVPSRINKISSFILRAMLAGTMTSYLTACTAGEAIFGDIPIYYIIY